MQHITLLHTNSMFGNTKQRMPTQRIITQLSKDSFSPTLRLHHEQRTIQTCTKSICFTFYMSNSNGDHTQEGWHKNDPKCR